MKNNNYKQLEDSSHSIGKLIFQLRRLERNPRTFSDAGTLTPSEIHAVDAIGEDRNILMSQLADRLGVTKGAITQVVGRLEKKGIVCRTPHPEDSRAVEISLTEKGVVAYQAHRRLHQNFYRKLREQLSSDEIAIFEKCVKTFTSILNEENDGE
ncbi:MarR family transcriptional regulator [Virgibacillus sp. AGTR]|uniref:MarR family transcriptional regulator n=2 Tax=Bacillaceae TaxID=186817 RepID=A0A941DPV0_9BACI|nr:MULTISPECIES: MarR family transcriptional regulator [Bacillaceae]NAZ07444.1 MarR family transcriptional regulator [Agaribacter marinus]MBR7794724.1 MarR family transcriptional regulator [Virgibacillus salarius]MCC2249578.1 MarR family transcriptional regulator [Virgibacillus sp. AGTR]MDY7044522.1 MarR family transcriptional regulator [Virgibacillus sp. M23]QRZ19342.1 MarR family transcriptional regulator [Virgibacillus sp. AGTR]